MKNFLLSGFTGNIGYEVAAQLSTQRIRALARDATAAPSLPHVEVIESLSPRLAEETEVIIHCAANTAFRVPLDELRAANVAGTQVMVKFAQRCPRLKKFIHVSTVCVSGDTTGLIAETDLPRPVAFLNAYEESKWEAEQGIREADLPTQIIRLSIVAGSERDGSVRRPGALHHTLFWLSRGLIPMMPGSYETPVDIISTEHAASFIVAAAHSDTLCPVLHACAGAASPCLGELLDHLRAEFCGGSAAWRSGAILLPELVDARTFAMFENTVRQSGDLLFQRICGDARSFLPSLLYPRVYQNENAVSLNPRPLADWRTLASLVSHDVIDHHTRSSASRQRRLSIHPFAPGQ